MWKQVNGKHDRKINSTILTQILDEHVCISFCTNALGKYMTQPLFLSAMGK